MVFQVESCVRRYFNTVVTHVRIRAYANCLPLKILLVKICTLTIFPNAKSDAEWDEKATVALHM